MTESEGLSWFDQLSEYERFSVSEGFSVSKGFSVCNDRLSLMTVTWTVILKKL